MFQVTLAGEVIIISRLAACPAENIPGPVRIRSVLITQELQIELQMFATQGRKESMIPDSDFLRR